MLTRWTFNRQSVRDRGTDRHNDIWILRLDCGSFGLVLTRLLCSILYFGRSVSSCLVFTDTTKISGGLLSSRCTRQVKDPVAVAKTSDS